MKMVWIKTKLQDVFGPAIYRNICKYVPFRESGHILSFEQVGVCGFITLRICIGRTNPIENPTQVIRKKYLLANIHTIFIHLVYWIIKKYVFSKSIIILFHCFPFKWPCSSNEKAHVNRIVFLDSLIAIFNSRTLTIKGGYGMSCYFHINCLYGTVYNRKRLPFYNSFNSLSLTHLSRSLNDRWGIKDDRATTFLHSSLPSAFRRVSPNPNPVHSDIFSSLFLSAFHSTSLCCELKDSLWKSRWSC